MGFIWAVKWPTLSFYPSLSHASDATSQQHLYEVEALVYACNLQTAVAHPFMVRFAKLTVGSPSQNTPIRIHVGQTNS
jgi:hypothetical protein